MGILSQVNLGVTGLNTAYLEPVHEVMGLLEQVECVDEDHRHLARGEIAQLVKQIQDDHITSNESAGKGWPLKVVYRCPERL